MALVNLLPRSPRDPVSVSRTSNERDGDPDRRAQEVRSEFLHEARMGQQGYPWQIKPNNFPSGKALLNGQPALQVAAVIAATERLLPLVTNLSHGQDLYALRALLPQLCRRN